MNKPDNINLYFNLLIKYVMVEETKEKHNLIQTFREFYYNSQTAGILQSEKEINQWAVAQYHGLIEDIETKGNSKLRFWSIDFIKVQISQRKKTRAG